jgi:tetratricopeptide (TPR) repeat protein
MRLEPAAAIEDFDKALALNPRSLEALLNKSIALSETLRRPNEAVVVLDRLLDYYPDHVLARAGRGVVLARIGECERARKDAVECLRHDRTPFLLYQMAGLYAQISRHESGNDARREALQLLELALKNGFTDVAMLKSDSDLDPIRHDAEFERLADAAKKLNRSPKK